MRLWGARGILLGKAFPSLPACQGPASQSAPNKASAAGDGDVWRPFLGRQAAAWATDVSAPCRLQPSVATTEPVSGLTPRVAGLPAGLNTPH